MIEIGNMIFLESTESASDNKEIQRYKCRLVDIRKNELIIDNPIHEITKKFALMIKGDEYYAWFVGKDQAVYSFKTVVLAKEKGQIPMIVLKDPGKGAYKRIQRRNYVRVPASVNVIVHSVDQTWKSFPTRTKDLSGGGILIDLPEVDSFPKKGQVICFINLSVKPGHTVTIKTVCEVVRVAEDPLTREHSASLKFIGINEQERELIIRYCFDRQLELKRENR